MVWLTLKFNEMIISNATHFKLAKYEEPKRPSRPNFERNILKRTTDCGRHWGDLRAQFEMAVDALLQLYREKNLNDSDYTSDTEDLCPWNYFDNEQMVTLVRKDLAITLGNLIQHGLVGSHQMLVESNALTSRHPHQQQLTSLARPGPMSTLINLGLGCFNTHGNGTIIKTQPTHSWELILYYYDVKVNKEGFSVPCF